MGRFEDTAVTIYQVTLYDTTVAYVLDGRSSTERYTWYRAAFEAMARSFHRDAATAR